MNIKEEFDELCFAIEITYCGFFPDYVKAIKSWNLPKETEEDFIAIAQKLAEEIEASWPHYTNA